MTTIQIVFTLRAVQQPASMPISLASLYLIQAATIPFVDNVWELLDSAKSVSEKLASVRKLYEVHNIQNKVPDGMVSFPEETSQMRFGIELEFRFEEVACLRTQACLTPLDIRNVTFRYPGAANYALKNISFKLGPGSLCVR